MKKLFKKIGITFLSALFTGSLLAGVSACGANTSASVAPENSETTKWAAPDDGSLPTAHTAAENLAYIHGVFAAQKQYSLYIYTLSTAAINTQITKTYKDYKDGVLVSSEITTSSMVKSGMQVCIADGDAYVRFSQTPDSNTDNLNAVWDTEAPVFYGEESFNFKYGLFPTELTNYIINENTLKSASTVTVNGDGTFTQSYVLDPSSSTYYYQYGMKTRGGLTGYPDFQTINVEFTFDADWRVLSGKFKEVASVNKGITVTNNTNSEFTVSYAEEDFGAEHFAFYEDYYKQYIGSDNLVNGGGADEDAPLDVATVLANGFSKIMNGGQQFEINVKAGGRTYVGYVFASLQLEDILGTLAVKVSLGSTFDRQDLYIEYSNGEAVIYYGSSVALSGNLTSLKLVAEEFSAWFDRVAEAFAPSDNKGDLADGDTDGGQQDLMEAFTGAMVLTENSNSVKLSLDSDDLLGTGIGINIDLLFGLSGRTVTFRGASLSGLTISGSPVDLGVTMSSTTAAEITREKDTCYDLADFAESVYDLVSSDLVKVALSLDGSGEDVIPQLKGLDIDAAAYVNLYGATAGAELEVSYAFNNSRITVGISAYYVYTSDYSGDIIVTLTEFNGASVNLQVCCAIGELSDAVYALMELAGVESGSLLSDGASDGIAAVINGILTADLSLIVEELYAKNAKIVLGVNLDNLFEVIGLDIGIPFGSTYLTYDADINALSVRLAALGLNLTVCGADGEEGEKILTPPDTANCLDLSALLKMVTSAYPQIKEIIDSRSAKIILPEGSTYLSFDGVKLGLDGELGLVFKDNKKIISADLLVYLADNGSADAAELKFIINLSADDNTPYIRLAVNNSSDGNKYGVDIYKSDIDGVSLWIENLMSKISPFVSSGDNGEESSADILSAVMLVICNADVLENLLAFDLVCDGNSLSLTRSSSFAADISVTSGGAIGLSLAYGTDDVKLSASALLSAAGDNRLDERLFGADYTFASTRESSDTAFAKMVYDYLFSTFERVSLDNVLGSDTYIINLKIDGASGEIPDLLDTTVNAKIYYSNGWEGNVWTGNKMIGADIDVNANGTVVKMNAVLSGNVIYLSLEQVWNVALPGLKVKIGKDGLYETVEAMLTAVLDTDILTKVGTMLGADQTGLSSVNGEDGKDSAGSIAKAVTAVLSLKLSDVIECGRDEVTGNYLVTVDVDAILANLGKDNGYSVGVIQARTDAAASGLTLTAVSKNSDGNPWLTITSGRTGERISEINADDYISVDFLSVLINDAVKFATDDDGKMYDMFTFTGTISASIVKLINIQIDISTLTVAINGGDLYFSFIGKVSGGVVTSNTVGITYQGGYLTLAKALNTANPEYRIMTFDYFIDNMFNKNDSTLNWLLGVSDTIWNTAIGLMGGLVSGVSSSAQNTQDLYLYEWTEKSEDTEISLYDYISALRVIINGGVLTDINDIGSLESSLGVYDNYYGVDLNAGVLTGNVLTKLYAAITRDDVTGINGVKAYGAIQSYVTFNVDLTYCEGLTADDYYIIGSELKTGVSAPSLYDIALGVAAEKGYEIDFDYFVKYENEGYDQVFGCFNTADGTYGYTNMLYSYDLTVYGTNGAVYNTSVKQGSNVYLYDNENPVYADADKNYRVVYSADGETLLGNSILMHSDLTLYAVKRASVDLEIYSDGKYMTTVHTFEGDVMPDGISGYATLEGLFFDAEGLRAVEEGERVKAEYNGIKLYGLFIVNSVTADGVVYTFDKASKSYFVTGTGVGISAYYDVNSTLVLLNEINGYPVTRIESYALANTTGAEDKTIKNIVVPENIVSVGANAFTDNYGMLTAVFLADSVAFEGSAGSGKTMPFYGCSNSESDNEKTSLSVYYRNITANGDWRHFRYVNKVISFNFYIGSNGGAVYGMDEWCLLDIETVGAETVAELDFNALTSSYMHCGIKDTVYGQSQAETLANQLNAHLSAYRNDMGDAKYIVNVTSTVSASRVVFTVKVLLNQPVEITVYSALDMTFGGQTVYGGTPATVYATATDEGVALFAPVSDGGVFLGWAAERDGILQFVGEHVEESDGTFYAIWGVSKVGAQVMASVNLSGSSLSAPLSGNCKWYDGGWNEVNEISKQNTVVYTREIYTVNYKVSGNFKMNVTDTLSGTGPQATTSFSNSFTVLEGQRVTAVKVEGKKVEISVDGVIVTTLTLTKNGLFNYDFKDTSYDVTAGEDISLTFNW